MARTNPPTAPKKPRRTAKAEPEAPTQRSALDAAAEVLASVREAGGLTAKQLITQMTERGLWSSPSGKTPDATLYAAMIREISRKGDAARFCRVGPGRFAAAKSTPKHRRGADDPSVSKPVSPATEVDPGAGVSASKPPARKRRRAGAAS